MGRANRPISKDAVYHIITHANSSEPLFKDNSDRIKYLDLWKQAKTKHDFYCFGFCLMENHTHFVIKTPLANLSEFIHITHLNYVKYFNNRYSRTGTLIKDRFKSILIEDDSYLLSVIRYIHLNPVRSGITETSEDYFWSSHLSYSGILQTQLVDIDFVLSLFGTGSSDLIERIEEYKRFMSEDTHSIDIFKETMVKKSQITS